jgi:thiamine biosynthesis protein ThiI
VSAVEEHVRGTLDELLGVATPLFEPRVRGKTFAVRARTSGPTPYRSRDIEVALGAVLAPHGKVRLVDPEVTCHVEVRDGRVYLFDASQSGWRGLPIGSEGRGVALVSGGFDSAVAGWMMLRRGVALDYVFCRLGGPPHQLGALRVLQVLGDHWSYGDRPRVWVVPFEAVVDRIRAAARPALWQLVLKRLMYRTAIAVARRRRAHAIITGESLGQVSSQTLRNLRALEGRLELPASAAARRSRQGRDHRPQPRHRHLRHLVDGAGVLRHRPDKPATAASSHHVASDEAKIDLDVEALIESSQVLDVRRSCRTRWRCPISRIDTVPAGAIVLDLRSLVAYRAWHYPDALRLDLGEALKLVERFETGRRTSSIARLVSRAPTWRGVCALPGSMRYNFHGGLKSLVHYAVAHGLVARELLPDGMKLES